jgi:hypothetical protein
MAYTGMILNGLGFAHRPLSLTPQFFANTPLNLLLREGIDATMLNRSIKAVWIVSPS